MTPRLVSRLSRPRCSNSSRRRISASSSPAYRWPSLAQLMVTTPSDPVCSAEPKRPLPRLSSSRRSSCSRQHMERIMFGLSSELMLEVGQAVARRHFEQAFGVRAVPVKVLCDVVGGNREGEHPALGIARHHHLDISPVDEVHF